MASYVQRNEHLRDDFCNQDSKVSLGFRPFAGVEIATVVGSPHRLSQKSSGVAALLQVRGAVWVVFPTEVLGRAESISETPVLDMNVHAVDAKGE